MKEKCLIEEDKSGLTIMSQKSKNSFSSQSLFNNSTSLNSLNSSSLFTKSNNPGNKSLFSTKTQANDTTPATFTLGLFPGSSKDSQLETKGTLFPKTQTVSNESTSKQELSTKNQSLLSIGLMQNTSEKPSSLFSIPSSSNLSNQSTSSNSLFNQTPSNARREISETKSPNPFGLSQTTPGALFSSTPSNSTPSILFENHSSSLPKAESFFGAPACSISNQNTSKPVNPFFKQSIEDANFFEEEGFAPDSGEDNEECD